MDNGALEEADWQCCREPTLIFFFFKLFRQVFVWIMLPWGNSAGQVRLPPAPAYRNLGAKLQQQMGHFPAFICQISRWGVSSSVVSKDQVLTGLPHKKRATVHVRNNSNYCQRNFPLERACSPQPWALGMTYGQRRNKDSGGKFGIYYCAIRDTNMGSKIFLTKKKYFWQKAGKLVS